MNNPITEVPLGRANAYLIKTEIGFILVDAGPADKIKKLTAALDKLNADITEIDLIIVTHAHSDHVGSLQEIKKQAQASVLVHRREKQRLMQGEAPLSSGTGILTKLLAKGVNNLLPGLNQFAPVEPDLIMEDKFDLTDYGISGQVVATPGHTPGSISVIINERHCLCGDLIVNSGLKSMHPPFVADQKQLLNSWQLIQEYQCTDYYPGHGQKFTQDKFAVALANQMNS